MRSHAASHGLFGRPLSWAAACDRIIDRNLPPLRTCTHRHRNGCWKSSPCHSQRLPLVSPESITQIEETVTVSRQEREVALRGFRSADWPLGSKPLGWFAVSDFGPALVVKPGRPFGAIDPS